MSVNSKYRRITPQELTEFQRDPEQVMGFFGLACSEQLAEENASDDEDFDEDVFLDAPVLVDDPERLLDISNQGQAIHFLLTGQLTSHRGNNVMTPLEKTVEGGVPLGDFDMGYGPPRFLTPDEVSEIATALKSSAPADLGRCFDVSAYNALGGYPRLRPDGWEQGDVELLLETYSALRLFFQQAADTGDAMLLWAD